MQRALLAFALCLCALGPAPAQITGRAAALGSDTLAIDGRSFQLYGIDGVEFHQSCLVDGRQWACGASATRALQTLLDLVDVTCTPAGESTGTMALVTCTSSDDDVAEEMVRQGWALAETSQSDAYIDAEEAARAAGDGVWRGVFMEPAAFRADMAAIERRYAALVSNSVVADAERALTDDEDVIEVFDGYRIVQQADGEGADKAAIRIPGLEPGFIVDTIEPQEAFSWTAVSQVLESWRKSTAAEVRNGVLGGVWSDLLNRPFDTFDTESGDTYYAAMMEKAAPWIEQGRQPVLLVVSPAVPGWIYWWFNEEPPAGADVSYKSRIHSSNYLGTIEGVDVYVGRAPDTESLLFPDDLLVEVAYTSENGHILATDENWLTDLGDLVVRYSARIEWLDDRVVRLSYPGEEAELIEGS